MKKTLIVFLVTACFLSLFTGVTSGVEAEASIRYLNVETITYEEDYPFNFGDSVACTHFAYTFALFKVNAWADRCYYVAYVAQGKDTIIVAKWSVGFSVTGGLQGIWIDYSTSLLAVHTIMAEFPYESKLMDNTIDGTQTYKFYRMHFYFKGELFKGEVVTVAADYMKEPSISTVSLIQEIKKSTVTQSLTGDSVSYLIQKTNPQGFKFKEVHHDKPKLEGAINKKSSSV